MARAITFHAVVSGKTLPLPDLSAFDGERVEVVVTAEEAPSESQPSGPARRFGTMAGQFVVPEDFNTPLRSPLDVPGIDLPIPVNEIVELVDAGRQPNVGAPESRAKEAAARLARMGGAGPGARRPKRSGWKKK